MQEGFHRSWPAAFLFSFQRGFHLSLGLFCDAKQMTEKGLRREGRIKKNLTSETKACHSVGIKPGCAGETILKSQPAGIHMGQKIFQVML